MKTSSYRGSRWQRILARFIAALLVLVSLGLAYQYGGQILDRRAIHAPGKFVPVDGADVHLHCTGEGSPVVILEAGATGFAQTWGWVQADLSTVTRVCSYDRAGMGWSEPSRVGHDGEAIIRNLRALLQQAGEPGPYVMVGHSLGGSFVELYAARYPEDVIALGLVDPTHPDQLERLPPLACESQERLTRVLQPISILSHVGVMRASNILGRLWEGLPEPDEHAARMFLSSPRHLQTTRSEYVLWEQTMQAVRQIETFGNLPLLVISSTEGLPDDMTGILQEMHAEMAGMSSQSQWVKIDGATHYTLLTDREHATATADALRALIEEAQTRMAGTKLR